MSRIDVKDLYTITFYEYGEAYYGSAQGYRFRIAREPLANVHYTPPDKRGEQSLRAQIWPEPLGYAAADRSSMEEKEFSFTQDGLEQACAWLNERIARDA